MPLDDGLDVGVGLFNRPVASEAGYRPRYRPGRARVFAAQRYGAWTVLDDSHPGAP